MYPAPITDLKLKRTSLKNSTRSTETSICSLKGGSNYFAVKGCSEIPPSTEVEYDYIAAAMGTGGTLAGLIAGAPDDVKVLGFPVLKGARFLEEDTLRLLSGFSPGKPFNFEMFFDYHFGGYARSNEKLLSFIAEKRSSIGFLADRIYFGKMLYGIYDLIEKGYFPEYKTIISIKQRTCQLKFLPVKFSVISVAVEICISGQSFLPEFLFLKPQFSEPFLKVF